MERSGLIGQTLNGRYKVEELLGQGGMSAVYKAFDPNLKRMVAVKVIHSHLAGDARFRSRFESEATAVAALRHSNIVQVYDFSNDDDLYYMVQEFVPGETLQDHLRRLNEGGRSMPVADALRYTGDIAEAAGYAHRRGMIHRDIKPANIMLSVHDEAILMDFGIVKITGSSEHTVTGAVVGTALYMPPELIRGEVPDPRSDIYSLGVTLYEMVSGRPPFDANSAMTLLMMHLQDPVPELREVRPDVPDPLMDIVRQALAKDREERFASMEDLGRALRNLRDHLETGVPLLHALPTEIEARADQPPGDEETLPDTAPRPRPQEAPAIPLRARRTPPARQAPVQGEVPATAGGPATMGEAYPPAPPPSVPPPTGQPRRLAGRGLWAGGAVVLLALLLGLGYLVMNRPWDGGDADGALAAAEATATAEATAQDQPAALATGTVAGENGDPAEEAAAARQRGNQERLQPLAQPQHLNLLCIQAGRVILGHLALAADLDVPAHHALRPVKLGCHLHQVVGQAHDPGDGKQQYDARDHCQRDADRAGARLLLFRQLAGENGNKNDVVDAKDNFQRKQRSQRRQIGG